MVESIEVFLSVLPTFLVRSAFSILCGGMIGLERERRGKPAGFRTNTLICLGSCLYMLVSEFIYERMGPATADPTRVASQVVTGIGFLGAGTIIQSRGTITGLTSAATIWVVAAIGLFIGAGFPAIALLCSILVLLSLGALRRIEPRLLGRCHFVSCDIIYSEQDGRTRAALGSVLSEHDVDISTLETGRIDETSSMIRLSYCDRHPAHYRFLSEVWGIPGIIEVKKPINHSANGIPPND